MMEIKGIKRERPYPLAFFRVFFFFFYFGQSHILFFFVEKMPRGVRGSNLHYISSAPHTWSMMLVRSEKAFETQHTATRLRPLNIMAITK